MLGWAAIAGWALKKWWRAVAETGAKVAITASLWETLWAKVAYGTAKTVEWIGKWTVKIGEILQVPYKVTNKMAEAIIMPPINLVWKWLKIGVELSGKVPWVQQVATLVKWSVVRVLAGEGARIVGSRDAPSLPKYQIGATGDIGKVKPFEKWEWKPIVEAAKMPEVKVSENPKRLYEDPEYTFLAWDEYQKLREVLPNLLQRDIIWEWLNGIILKHPDTSKVIKIAKPNWDKLAQEFLNQKGFTIGLRDLKKQLEGTADYELLKKFNIPNIDKVKWAEWIYEMEKINGINFKTYATIKYYQEALKDLPEGWHHWMTDNEITVFLEWRGLKVYPKNWTEMNERWWDTVDRHFLVDLESEWNKLLRSEGVDKVVNLLRQNGYNHGDYHWWNAMITPDWNIYIIDFWRSKIPNQIKTN